MRKFFALLIIISLGEGCLFDKQKQAESILSHYIERKTQLIINYNKEISLASWNAIVSGKESDYKKMIDLEIDFSKSNRNISDHFSPDHFTTITKNVFTDEDDFTLLKKMKKSGLIADTILSRQLLYLYHSFTSTQIESEKYKKLLLSETKLTKVAWSKRVVIDGKSFNNSSIDSIRKITKDPKMLEKIALSYLQSGKLIAPLVIQLVKDRNEIAVSLGFPSWYHMKLEEKDQSPERIQSLIAEIEFKTRDRFMEVKQVIDKKLAKRYRILPKELKPWHYNNIKYSYLPASFIEILDSLYAPVEPIKRTSDFFAGIGLPIDDVIEKSELKNGKMDGTFVIDFSNDIRMTGSITNNFDGLSKVMHEGAHAAHYKNIAADLPYLLKGPSLFIAEGIASYFMSLPSDSLWISQEVQCDEKTREKVAMISSHFSQVDQMFKLRKQMVFADFEREIYTTPDQDLNLLWHNLNLKYLGIDYPYEKETYYWSTNKYPASLSCNVQNYIVADIFAAQLKHAIETQVLHNNTLPLKDNKNVGKYLIDHLFKYGDLLPWEDLVVRATGEKLNTSYLVKQISGGE